MLCWTELGRYSREAGALMDIVSPIVLMLSLVFLLEYGRNAIGRATGQIPGIWIHIAAVLLALFGKVILPSNEAWI